MHDPFHDFTMEMARVCANLAAIVEWCVEHDGECLGDHPHIFAKAKDALARKRALSEVRVAQGVETEELAR
jgi:hypothetical protein